MESDQDYRRRFQYSVAKNALGTSESLRGEIFGLDGVTHCKVIENDGDRYTWPEHYRGGAANVAFEKRSFMIIVRGGEAADIAEAIYYQKPLGVSQSGRSHYTINGHTIRWQTCHDVPTVIEIGVTKREGFPYNGVQLIKYHVEQFINDLDIGETLDIDRMLARVIENVAGFSPSELDNTTVGRLAGHTSVALRTKAKDASRIDRAYDSTGGATDKGLRESDLITVTDTDILVT